MATWTACIVETQGRADFWAVVRRSGVIAATTAVPNHALIDCNAGFDFTRPLVLARELSTALATTAIGFVAQTGADVHQLHVFARGDLVRKLDYSHDGGGWLAIEGTPQAWERDYFFDPDDEPELADPDLARYVAARRTGDPTSIISLVHPSSTAGLTRVCAALGIAPTTPAGRWIKPSLWARVRRALSPGG